jgi:hypothetical protein
MGRAHCVQNLLRTARTVEHCSILEHGPSPDASGNFAPTLTVIQNLATIPTVFPRKLNTCGR